LASSYYGRPRTTLDLDVIVCVTERDLGTLAAVLTKANLKVQERKLEMTWRSEYRIATIEDKRSPHILDIIFTDQKLERKAGRILGLPAYYQSAESLILAKLRMIEATLQPERAATDREDIKAILDTTRIDLRTLRRKAREESTAKILDELIS